MSTRCTQEKRASAGRGAAAWQRLRDLAEEVAHVAHAKRELLLRVHRFRLRREDLEDCFSQAIVEILGQVRRGGSFESRAHVAHALELRFLSRVRDRRRALSGRSPMQAALEDAVVLPGAGDEGPELADNSASVEELVLLRIELGAIGSAAKQLTSDQRRVLGSQLSGETCEQFSARHGWTREKYRKVAQRARARLRSLTTECETSVPVAGRPSEEISGPTYAHVIPHK